MRYTVYQGTRYEYKTTIPNRKKISGKVYELADVFPNYGSFQGHKTARDFAKDIRERRGGQARVEAHSGYTTVYTRTTKSNLK